MICRDCGNVIEDNAVRCKFCNANTSAYIRTGSSPSQETKSYEQIMQNRVVREKPAQAPASRSSDIGRSRKTSFFNSEEGEEPAREKTVKEKSVKEKKEKQEKPKTVSSSAPATPSGGLSLLPMFASIAAAVMSLVCLLTISTINSTITKSNKSLVNALQTIANQNAEIVARLDTLDGTVANVQSSAYNQLAEQNISITKDITPLVEPVTAGKYNVMFIVKAKGSLNIDTSFVWQKYNSVTGDYENITFTGIGVNDTMGLRIENGYDKSTSEYEAKLWANGITTAAAGTYRCKIIDGMGITKNTASATVEVIEAS